MEFCCFNLSQPDLGLWIVILDFETNSALLITINKKTKIESYLVCGPNAIELILFLLERLLFFPKKYGLKLVVRFGVCDFIERSHSSVDVRAQKVLSNHLLFIFARFSFFKLTKESRKKDRKRIDKLKLKLLK